MRLREARLTMPAIPKCGPGPGRTSASIAAAPDTAMFDHPPINTVMATTVPEFSDLAGLIEQDPDLNVVMLDSAAKRSRRISSSIHTTSSFPRVRRPSTTGPSRSGPRKAVVVVINSRLVGKCEHWP